MSDEAAETVIDPVSVVAFAVPEVRTPRGTVIEMNAAAIVLKTVVDFAA